MEIKGRTVLILGGSGLVGLAVARRVLEHEPRALVISALRRDESEGAVSDLRAEGAVPPGTELSAEWGDIFLPEAMKDRSRADVLAESASRARLLDNLYGELSDE